MGKKVLVVDDERLIVKGIKFSLVQDDMEVDCAYDGEEALEMAKKTEYDIEMCIRDRCTCCFYRSNRSTACNGCCGKGN